MASDKLSTVSQFGHKFGQLLGGKEVHDPFCPILPGRFIPILRRILLRMLIFRLGPVDSLKLSGSPILLVYYDLGKIFPCSFFP